MEKGKDNCFISAISLSPEIKSILLGDGGNVGQFTIVQDANDLQRQKARTANWPYFSSVKSKQNRLDNHWRHLLSCESETRQGLRDITCLLIASNERAPTSIDLSSGGSKRKYKNPDLIADLVNTLQLTEKQKEQIEELKPGCMDEIKKLQFAKRVGNIMFKKISSGLETPMMDPFGIFSEEDDPILLSSQIPKFLVWLAKHQSIIEKEATSFFKEDSMINDSLPNAT